MNIDRLYKRALELVSAHEFAAETIPERIDIAKTLRIICSPKFRLAVVYWERYRDLFHGGVFIDFWKQHCWELFRPVQIAADSENWPEFVNRLHAVRENRDSLRRAIDTRSWDTNIVDREELDYAIQIAAGMPDYMNLSLLIDSLVPRGFCPRDVYSKIPDEWHVLDVRPAEYQDVKHCAWCKCAHPDSFQNVYRVYKLRNKSTGDFVVILHRGSGAMEQFHDTPYIFVRQTGQVIEWYDFIGFMFRHPAVVSRLESDDAVCSHCATNEFMVPHK